MLHKLFSAFSKPIQILTAPRANTLIIQAFPNKSVLYVSYRGKVKSAYFHDNTLKNVLHGKHYTKNANKFLSAVGQLIQQIIND